MSSASEDLSDADISHLGHFSESVMAIIPHPVPRSSTFILLSESSLFRTISIRSSVSGLGIRVDGDTIKLLS